MTAMRLIPLPVHGALELLTGLLTMVAPFAFGFGPAAAVVSVAIGATLVGLSLAATASADPVDPRATLPVSTHHALDYGLTLGLLAAAGVVAFDGDQVAGVVLAAIGGVQLLLNLSTRYSQR